MFTGIVEEVGTIKSINRGQHSAVLTVRAKTVLEGTRIGDSIAVNGICLTVRQLFPDSFAADVMHETLNRSALAQLTVGSAVNLERAMPANGRFGGHIVAGHVDGVGRIANIRPCRLYKSDAADDMPCVGPGRRRPLKTKNRE